MKILDLFRRKSDDNYDEELEKNGVKIKFGFRDEDLIYQQAGKEIYAGFTWVKGSRIFPDEIKKWRDGSRLTQEEQKNVFVELLNFVNRKKGKPIIVINKNDASKSLWEDLCSINKSLIKRIEFTSDEEVFQFRLKMGLDALKSGGQIIITDGDGNEIKSEQDLKRHLISSINKKREHLDD